MKKLFLLFGTAFLLSGNMMAQDSHAGHGHETPSAQTTPAVTQTAPASSLRPENLAFKTEEHDFGSVAEGPAAEYEFEFKNTGKEPILLQQVQASCGCTTPSYSKDPVLPGKSGTIKASFSTQGRGGAPFNKTITVVSNAGTKVLTIKGTVEKAPESSVPENSSMVKTR